MTRRSISRTKRAELFQFRGGICHLCDGKIQSGEAWEIEHRIALALGGADDETNMMLAHVKCHKPKTRKDAGDIAKAKRLELRRLGIRKPRTMTRWRKLDRDRTPVYATRER